MFKNDLSPLTSPNASLERRGVSSIGCQPARDEIGFIGLGHMGTAMAANLAVAGYRVRAYVRRPARMDELVALGVEPTTKITDLFDCSIVISMLPDDAAVGAVVFGREDLGQKGLAEGSRPAVDSIPS